MRIENRQVALGCKSEVYRGFNKEEIREMISEIPNRDKVEKEKSQKMRLHSGKMLVLDTFADVKESFKLHKTQEILQSIKQRTMRASKEIYENSIKNQTILSKEWATSSRDKECGI